MKIWSKVAKHSVVGLAVLVCLTAAAVPASAVNSTEVLREVSVQHFTGPCCFLWGETVFVTEPRTPSPVVLTWNTDYFSTAHFFVGLSLNGGPCNFYGPREVFGLGVWFPAAYQWVIFPSDGVVSGTNKFELCGGDADGKSGTAAIIGNNTLTARIGN
jgi:hypothetical protein